MKIQWLEKLASEGKIRKEVLASIYNDVSSTIKEANSREESMKKMKDMIEAYAPNLIGGAIIGSGVLGFKALKDKFNESKTKSSILKNRAEVVSSFGKDSDKAKARFDEIMSIAPHVALNKPLVTKLVSSKLHSGLTDHDAQSLALI